jgi:signal transduction histidine kinase
VLRQMGVRHLVPYSGVQTALAVDQQRRIERAVAVARTLIALFSLVAFTLSPVADEPYRQIANAILLGYFVFALGVVVVFGITPKQWTVDARWLHAIDVLVAVTVTILTSGTGSSSFGLFLFTLLAAAYRWGFVETLATAGVAVALLVVDAMILMLLPGLLHGAFDLDRLIVRSSYVLLVGGLIGYLVHNEKQLRGEATAVAAILTRVDVRAGLKPTMTAVLDSLLQLFDARRAVFVVSENVTRQQFRWEASRSGNGVPASTAFKQIQRDDFTTYMFEPDAAAWQAVRRRSSRGDRWDIVAVDRRGSHLAADAWTMPQEFVAAIGPFDQLMAVDVELGTEWTGRLFLVNPVIAADRYSALALGQRVVRQIAPAVQNIYLLRRLRASASAIERGRIARELHDGVIQTVTGVEIQVAALGLRLADESPSVGKELDRLHTTLREEGARLRDFMQQMKPLEIDPDQLVDALADFVQRFERETGIGARFVTQLDRVALTPRACREVARILEEALVNIRRHSGARNVIVRLSTVNGSCCLSIDDDGCGFPFTGRLSQADLEASRKGPVVIKERVRQIGGALTVESDPGRGSRLEIAVPLSHYANH